MASYEAGTAFIGILPSFKNFGSKLAHELTRLNTAFELQASINTATLATSLHTAQQYAASHPLNLQAQADVAHLQAQIHGIHVAPVTVTTQADLDAFNHQIQQAGHNVPPVDVPTEPNTSKWKGKLKAAGLAAGVLVVGGINEAIDQQKNLSKVSASLGLDPAASAKLGKQAGEIYAQNYGESLPDVENTMASVYKNLGKGNDQWTKDAAIKVLNISSAFDQDANDVTKAAGTLVKTGLAKDSNEAFDIITKGFQGGLDSSGDFLDSLNEYSSQFSKLGIDAGTATTLISQGLAGGAVNGDKVVDAFKEFSLRAVSGSKAATGAYQTLGLDAAKTSAAIAGGGPAAKEATAEVIKRINGMKDPLQRSATATALFGTQFEDLGSSFASLDLTKASDQADQFAGSADKMGATLGNNAANNISTFTRSVKQGFIDFLGKTVIPILTTVTGKIMPIANAVKDALTPAFSALNALVGGGNNGLAIFVGLIVALGGAILAAKVAMATYNGIMTVVRVATAIWTGVQAAFNFVMALNPIALVVLAIIALVAIIIIAYKKSETFRAVVKAAWDGIKIAIQAVWNFIKDYVIHPLIVAFKSVSDAAMWLYHNGIQPAWNGIKTAINAVWGFIKTYIFGPIVAYFHLLVAGATILKNGIVGAWNLIKSGISTAWNWIKTAVFAVITREVNGLKIIFNTLKDGIVKAWDLIKGGINTAWTWIKNNIFAPFKTAMQTIVDKANDVKTKFLDAFGKIRDGIKGIIDKIVGFIQPIIDKIQGMLDKINDAKNAVTGGAKKAAGKVTSGAKKAGSWIASKFATGGIYPGYTPGRDIGLAAVSGGEAIMRPEWTRAVGPGFVHGMNAVARKRGVRGVRAVFQGHFANGGVAGTVAPRYGAIQVDAPMSGRGGPAYNFGDVHGFTPDEVSASIERDRQRRDALTPTSWSAT